MGEPDHVISRGAREKKVSGLEMAWKHAITSGTGEFSKCCKLEVSIAISRNVIELTGIKRN